MTESEPSAVIDIEWPDEWVERIKRFVNERHSGQIVMHFNGGRPEKLSVEENWRRIKDKP